MSEENCKDHAPAMQESKTIDKPHKRKTNIIHILARILIYGVLLFSTIFIICISFWGSSISKFFDHADDAVKHSYNIVRFCGRCSGSFIGETCTCSNRPICSDCGGIKDEYHECYFCKKHAEFHNLSRFNGPNGISGATWCKTCCREVPAGTLNDSHCCSCGGLHYSCQCANE